MNMFRFNQPLQVGVIPPTTTKVYIYINIYIYDFDQPRQIVVFPTSLITLSLKDFDQPLQIGVLPSTITNSWKPILRMLTGEKIPILIEVILEFNQSLSPSPL